MRILPSMGRPDRCQLAIDSMIKCEISTPGIVLVNGLTRIEEYRKLQLPDHWTLIELPVNIGVCGALNLGFRMFPHETWYSLACDDELVHTAGFDTVLATAAGDWHISHANDGWLSSRRIWSFTTLGGELVRSIGYLAPPGLWHYYWDDFIEHIAAELALRRWCETVTTEHRHHYAGTALDDETYQAGRSRWGDDECRFKKWRDDEWPSIRLRLQGKMSRSQLNP